MLKIMSAERPNHFWGTGSSNKDIFYMLYPSDQFNIRLGFRDKWKVP